MSKPIVALGKNNSRYIYIYIYIYIYTPWDFNFVLTLIAKVFSFVNLRRLLPLFFIYIDAEYEIEHKRVQFPNKN